ncbi:MAG TPA: class I SAM-dependent methyltransferase [Ktedonobacteraceae bacterium]|jgi:SAM-dependent methyltransferase|nr:class I SAM-dependent methyltransferase [Ktedonobacteraceae bacterium]
MVQELYTSGAYLEKNLTWHVEESPWKARQIMRMVRRNHIVPKTICEVGCGAGEVLKQLQGQMDSECLFWGYDISPQALELSKSRANERLQFKLADITQEQDAFFDLILVMDVIEHLEDYFSFLRDIRSKSHYTIFHIPLDLSVQTILRRNGLLKVRESFGHIHYFTKEIAIRSLKDVGYEVLDSFYTARATELPTHEIRRNLLKLPRKLLFSLNQDLAAHVLGGWSLLVLAT